MDGAENRAPLFAWADRTTWKSLLRLPRARRTADHINRIFPSLFSDIGVYHAARPLDVRTYYEAGLQIADYHNQQMTARQIFLTSEFPTITHEMLDAAIARVGNYDNKRAFVCLDERSLLDTAGHYLVYGSEYLCGIAAALNGFSGLDYRQVLKRYGIPTMFRIRLPICFTSASEQLELATAIAEELAINSKDDVVTPIDFTFRLSRPLPPELILGHYHPAEIRDPLLQQIYRVHAS